MTTEECLIIGFSNQEQQSLIELYNRYSRLLWKISYRVVADEAISEQIVRGVFRDAWENPEKFNNGKKLSTLMIECCLSQIDTLIIQKIS